MLERLRRSLIEKLGGFTDIEEAIESLSDTKIKHRLLTRAVKRHFNTLGPDDILKEAEGGQWMFERRPLSKQEVNLLKAETAQLLEMRLWKVLQADIKYQANRKMFLLSETDADLVAGKLWVYTLDAFHTRLKSITKGGAQFNSEDKTKAR